MSDPGKFHGLLVVTGLFNFIKSYNMCGHGFITPLQSENDVG